MPRGTLITQEHDNKTERKVSAYLNKYKNVCEVNWLEEEFGFWTMDSCCGPQGVGVMSHSRMSY